MGEPIALCKDPWHDDCGFILRQSPVHAMRKLKDVEIIFVVFSSLTLLLGALVIHYRGVLRDYPSGFESFTARNIEFVTDFYGLRYHGVSNNLIDAHILYFGAFEKPLLHWLGDTAELLEDDDLVFLDIGANTGQHTLFMSRHAATVHSFEPYPPVLEQLRKGIEINLLDNAVVHPIGLGATNEVLEFFEPPHDNQGTGSFVSEFEDRSSGVTELRVVVGDQYLRAQRVERVDLVKIDVEGYEKSVLAGLVETLERQRPIIVMELTVASDLDEPFKSREELVSAFPGTYEFALLPSPYAAEFRTGKYEIEPFTATTPSFLVDGQWTVVAYPAEKAAAVSWSNTAN